jgi:uncharacterized membrane protein YfcA
VKRFSDISAHVFRLIPLSDADWSRLSVHLLASFLIALASAITTSLPPREIFSAWMASVLIYTAGYLQHGEKQPTGTGGDDDFLPPLKIKDVS